MAETTPLQVLQQARQTIVDLRTVLDPFDAPAKVVWASSAHALASIDACISAALPAAAVPTDQSTRNWAMDALERALSLLRGVESPSVEVHSARCELTEGLLILHDLASPAPAAAPSVQPDPHGKRYECERTELCMGFLSDDELANEAFLNYDSRPTPDQLLAGTHFLPIAYMTAVKDRIRWLSRKLKEATVASPIGGAAASEGVTIHLVRDPDTGEVLRAPSMGSAVQQQMDKGPWTIDDDARCLRSDDFTHDVVLKISGDFSDDGERRRYAEELCSKLNGIRGSAGDAGARMLTADEIDDFSNNFDGMPDEYDRLLIAKFCDVNGIRLVHQAAGQASRTSVQAAPNVPSAWIPATERLPQPYERVLLVSQSWPFPSICTYAPDYLGAGPKFVESFRGQEMAYWYPERMHWMPLPPPPGALPAASPEVLPVPSEPNEQETKTLPSRSQGQP